MLVTLGPFRKTWPRSRKDRFTYFFHTVYLLLLQTPARGEAIRIALTVIFALLLLLTTPFNMHPKLLLLLLLFPMLVQAHPGVGIVTDSKGAIYYTDLQRIWRIQGGTKTVVVPGVHTHELYIDSRDQLFGENERYEAGSSKFYHYLWRYRPNGQIDTVRAETEAYVQQDFSLARDQQGNQYYTKQFLVRQDTTHIYKRTPEGVETVLARGQFKGVVWLHPQKDGSVLYVSSNTLYRVDTAGRIQLIKKGLGSSTPSFSFSRNSITIWGAWQDRYQDYYVAVFSDGAVKKIDAAGNMSVVYRSNGNWAPLHGVFDREGRLWVLEGSDRNEVRVTRVSSPSQTSPGAIFRSPAFLVIGCLVVAGLAYQVYKRLR